MIELESYLVSVIIPVYNVKPYLSESINSVLNQTFHNLEIILIDDGSTDGSSTICDNYAKQDTRIIVIHQKNEGLSAARNAGLNAMHGDVVAFLDADDVYYFNMIETMLKAMYQNNTDIVICDYKMIQTRQQTNKQGDHQFLTVNILSSSEALNQLISGTIRYNVWNKIYKKNLFSKIRFVEGHVYEDVIFTCKTFELCNRVAYLQQVLIQYRNRKNNISNTINDKNIKDFLLTARELEAFVESHISAPLTAESISLFREKNARSISLRYYELLGVEGLTETVKELRAEALSQWEKTTNKFHDKKSRIVYYSIRYFPHFYLPIYMFYRHVKQLNAMWWFT